MSLGKVLLGLLAGVAAGATLGILLAPDKGSSTRKKITQKGDDYVEGLGERFNEFTDGINKKYDSLKEKATHLMETGKTKLEKYESDGVAAVK